MVNTRISCCNCTGNHFFRQCPWLFCIFCFIKVVQGKHHNCRGDKNWIKRSFYSINEYKKYALRLSLFYGVTEEWIGYLKKLKERTENDFQKFTNDDNFDSFDEENTNCNIHPTPSENSSSKIPSDILSASCASDNGNVECLSGDNLDYEDDVYDNDNPPPPADNSNNNNGNEDYGETQSGNDNEVDIDQIYGEQHHKSVCANASDKQQSNPPIIFSESGHAENSSESFQHNSLIPRNAAEENDSEDYSPKPSKIRRVIYDSKDDEKEGAVIQPRRKSTRIRNMPQLQEQQRSAILKNHLYTNNLVQKVKIPGKGYGIIAKEKIHAGFFICDYRGKVLDGHYADYLHTKVYSIVVGSYMYWYKCTDKGKTVYRCIDATAKLPEYGLSIFINHSRLQYNCKTVLFYYDTPKLFIQAIRDIEKGEELSFDYNDNDEETMEANPFLNS